MSELTFMSGEEFIRRIKKIAKREGISVKYIARRGKGSHGTLFYGDRFAIIPDLKDELKKGTLHALLAQLGVSRDEFQGV